MLIFGTGATKDKPNLSVLPYIGWFVTHPCNEDLSPNLTFLFEAGMKALYESTALSGKNGGNFRAVFGWTYGLGILREIRDAKRRTLNNCNWCS